MSLLTIYIYNLIDKKDTTKDRKVKTKRELQKVVKLSQKSRKINLNISKQKSKYMEMD